MLRVVVFGLPRSGTTLVANLLNSQPHCSVYGDFLYEPLLMARKAGSFKTPLPARLRNSLGALMRHDVPDLVLPSHQVSALDFYEAALAKIARPGDRVVGHKVTGDVSLLDAVLGETDCRVVYIWRDPRDVAVSSWEWGMEDIEGILARWRRAAIALPMLRQHPRLVALNFEALLSSPASALAPVEKLLGIKVRWDQPSLMERVSDRPWRSNSAFNDITRVLDQRAANRWRLRVGWPAVRYATWLCTKELRALGCDTSLLTAIGRRERLRFMARHWANTAANRHAQARQRIRRFLSPPLLGEGGCDE